MKRLSTVLICIVLLIAAIPPAAADTAAEDLTDRCSFDFGSKKETGIDPRFFGKTVVTLKAGASFSFSWDEPLPDARLCLQWRNEPRDVALLQYGADGTLLSEETLPPYPETVSPLLPDARRAVIRNGAFDLRMQAAAVYGAGELPEPFHDWQELPAHVDYLLIATHPDDDVLYLGSIVPTYGAERGYVGTIVFVTNQNRDRTSEAENGAWAMGLRVRPVFLGMRDVYRGATKSQRKLFPYDELLLRTVRVYRQLRPLVVFAQDLNGEYGHWQHKSTAKAAREAFALAADPTFDPESAEEYGTWQVQKLFLHLYRQNAVLIDAHTPLAAFDGRDAYEVACDAFLKHRTQQRYHFRVTRDDGSYAFNRFGMAEGVVPVGEDVFDNIDETLFCGYVAPPTPEPSATPEPGATPKSTEPPLPTTRPTQMPAAPSEPPSPVKADPAPLLRIAAITVLAAIVTGVAAYFWKKRRNEKHPPEDREP